jgi:NO-binding membrane sensor protein with MHYT domain
MYLQIHQFSLGLTTPVIAYLVSVIGSFLGLRCAALARGARRKVGWLAAAAVAIGGTGIWGMHFIAMLGFGIQGAPIKYTIPLTVLSAVVAVAVVGIGICTVNLKRRGVPRLLFGGVITGGGVAAMHYTGMMAMDTNAEIHYRPLLVVASVVIGVVASTVALWFTLWVDGWATTAAAAVIMGVAVTGMHYTGMASMTARATSALSRMPGGGVKIIDLVTPLTVVVGLTIAELLLNVDMGEDRDEVRPAHPAEPGRDPAPAPAAAGPHARTEVIARDSVFGSQLRPATAPAARPVGGPNLLNAAAQ